MISHVFIGVTDFAAALRFYSPVLAALGLAQRFCDAARPWAGWQQAGQDRPLLLIGAPWNGQPAQPGNGNMLALLAPDRTAVERAWRLGLAFGGTDAGAPGLRPEYHAHYYGAYILDPDGNKLAFATHFPDPGQKPSGFASCAI